MVLCVVCKDRPEFDDIQMTIAPGRVFCVRCWHAAVEDVKRMPKDLQRDVVRTVDGAP